MNLTLIKRLLEAKNENTDLDTKTADKDDGGKKKVVDPAKDKPKPQKDADGKLADADNERNPDGSLKAEIPKGGKTLSGEPANKIDMDPTTVSKINEAKGSMAVVTFGRMNPPTVGHEMLVDKLCAIAKKHHADPLVFLSRTQDKKKNPIPYLKKLQFARRAFGSIVQPTPTDASSVFGILKHLEGQYSDIILVVGSDRVAELQAKVKKYNGTEFTFDSIQVQSAGERDPDDDSVAGVSASKLRQFAKEGKAPDFTEGLPEKLRGIALQVYKAVRLEEGLEDMTMNKKALIEQADLAVNRIEADYELSESEFRALYEKAEETGFPFDVIESSYKRGIHSWELTETILDHQQFAFNRVNAMLNGGSNLDDDLFEGFTGDIQLPLQDAQPNPFDQKQMHRTKVKPGKVKTKQFLRKILEHIHEDSIPGIKDGKGVRRVDMPQINDFDAFTKDLEANGVKMHEPKAYKPSALTPLQKHFNQEKVDLMKQQKGERKPIIASSDNKIIDGHHRWVASEQEGSDVQVRMVGMRHADLMGFLNGKPYVGSKKLSEDVYAEATRKKATAKSAEPDSKEHHENMAAYHELISAWHRTHERHRAADASAARARLHHEAVRARS